MKIIIDKNKQTNYKDNFININNNNITFTNNGEHNITIKNSTNLNLNIKVEKDVHIKLFIESIDNKLNIKNNYILNENSNLFISKFYSNKEVKEEEIIELNGKEAKFNYKFASIGKNNEDYHIIINHNDKNTSSYISNKCIGCNNSKINFIIDSILPKGNTSCIMDQTTKILTLGDVQAKIEPNMFIDEDTVSARHGSVIGTFSYDDIFYLMSRGITEEEAYDLLLKGFLFSNLELNMENKAKIYECIKAIRR